MGPISKFIISSLDSTNSSNIITNRYRYSFFLNSIPNCFTIYNILWFLITPLFTIALNCLSHHLIFKFKYLLIVPLRV